MSDCSAKASEQHRTCGNCALVSGIALICAEIDPRGGSCMARVTHGGDAACPMFEPAAVPEGAACGSCGWFAPEPFRRRGGACMHSYDPETRSYMATSVHHRPDMDPDCPGYMPAEEID